MSEKPPCTSCGGSGKYTFMDFGLVPGPLEQHESECISCNGTGKGPGPDDCPECDGRGKWWTCSHPDDTPDVEYCKACHGTGKRVTA